MAGPYDSNTVRRSGPYAENGGPTGPRGPYSSGNNGGEPAGPLSLWGQFKKLRNELPAGLVHMGADVAQDAFAVTQVPSALGLGTIANVVPGGADLVQGIHRNRVLRSLLGEEMVTNAAGGMGFTENVHASMPFMGAMGTSMRGTGERMVNQAAALAPGGLAAGDSMYGEAVRNGTIVPVAIEDIGNASLVASGLSRVAAAAAEPAVAASQAAEATARAVAPAGTGGATAARSVVVPSAEAVAAADQAALAESGRAAQWVAKHNVRASPRAIARERALPTSPSLAMLDEAVQAAGPRVFEVGGAGPAATTQLVDDALVQSTRATADQLAARASRLQGLARNVHTVARLGDTVADTPATAWTAPAALVARKVGAPALDAFLRTGAGETARAYVDRTAGQALRNQRLRAEGRNFFHEEGDLVAAEGAGERRQVAIAAERLLEHPIEGFAGHLVVSGVADALGPTIRGMEDDLAAQFGMEPAEAHRWAVEAALGDIVRPKDFDPVDAFDLADQYAQTRAYNAAVEAEAAGGPPAPAPPRDLMPPEQMARIDESQTMLQEGIRDARESRYFRGWGESKGPRPDEEAAIAVQEMLDRGAGPREVSAKSAEVAAAARQREADMLVGRLEQRGSQPLSIVVKKKVTDKFAPKIDAAIDRVVEAQGRAEKAAERRIVDPDEFKRSVTARVKQLYEDARDVAATIVRTDPVLARTIAAPDQRIRLTDDQLIDRLAGRLVSARGSRNPELRQLMEDLKAAGFEVPFDLPNPAALLPAERRAGTAEAARIFARQAAGDEGTAATAAAQAQAWREKPQPIVEPRPGFSSAVERAAVATDRARRRAAAGPNVRDVDLEVRDRRRAAAAEAQGVEVRPGEPFRVPREKVTGEAAMPQPLQSYTDADGNVREGMLAELDMRGATLHPQVGGVSEVTPGRFMPNERVFLAYNDEGRAIGYLAIYGDTGLSIAVDPEARGQGVGVRLYEAAEAAGVDVHRNLADETFTADGARTYERFVNGPAEAEGITFDRPEQRRVFEKAAKAETDAETRARIARQGEQGNLPVERPERVTPDEVLDEEAEAQRRFERGLVDEMDRQINRTPEEELADALEEELSLAEEHLEDLRAHGHDAEAAEVEAEIAAMRAELADLAREMSQRPEANRPPAIEGGGPPPAERPPEGEHSPELNQRLDQHLAEFEQAGERAKYDFEGEWETKFGQADYLAHLPRQAFVAGDAQRVPAEWEWFTALPQHMQKMIRERYMAPDPVADARRVNRGFPADPRVGTGASPDQIAQAYSAHLGGLNANTEVPVEQAMAEFVRMIETRDALEHVTNPRSRATDAEIEMAAERMGMDPEVLKALRTTEGGRSRKAMLDRLAQVEANERAVDDLGPEPPAAAEGRRSPWEMSVEDFTAELAAAEAIVEQWAQAHPWDPNVDFGPVEPPEVQAAATRQLELSPLGFDDPASPMAPADLHALLVEAARKHGLIEGEAPTPARVFDPIARGVEAVADVEQRALEAFIEDAENRRVAKMSGQTVPREDYLYHTLNEPARRIYRQMVADTKVLTEEQRLELARRQLGQRLIGRGRRAQAPFSRQEGRLMARERIMQSRAEQSARRAERVADRLEAGPTQYEARTDAMSRAMGPIARGQRTVGLREGEARVRELDLGREERTLIRLLDKQAEAEAKVRNSPQAAPARFATELRAGGNLKKAIEEEAAILDDASEDGRGGDLLRSLTRDIPQSVFDATRLAGDAVDPEFLIGTDKTFRSNTAASLGKMDEQMPYIRKTGQERIKKRTEGTTDFTIRGQAIAEIKRFHDGVRNELARKTQEKWGVRADDLGVTGLRGVELLAEMDARDFVPWDPANPLGTPNPAQITGQTTFVPRQLVIAFAKSSFGQKKRWQLNVEQWYDKRFLGTIKTWWLALSPRWQLGNLVGNSLMAVIGGGVDPVTLARQMRNARALLAEDPEGELLVRQQHLLATRGNIPRTLLNRGMTHEEMTFLDPKLDKPVRNPVARLARKSYAMNEYTDNLFRSAVYLAKLEPRAHLWDQLDAGEISPETFLAGIKSTLSARQALDAALHAAGDFQRLTPFERNVIKRLWIFYPWYRHITKLTLSLPVNHPTRVIWTLHLAAVFGPDDEGDEQLPPFLAGSVPLGGDRFLRTGNLNPFGGVDSSPLLSPGAALSGLTPGITWPAALLFGVDLSRGGAQISRPPGTERLDAYGRPTNTPLLRHPAELFRYAVNQFPQGRAAYGALEEPVLRYGQGSPVIVQGETIPSGSTRLSTFGRLFGIPMPERVDVAAINQRRAEREAAARTARERYNENLSRAGAGR